MHFFQNISSSFLDNRQDFNYIYDMVFILDDYIDDYIRDADADADEFDKMVALHLKEIIPKTAHLEETVFNEILTELEKEMNNGKRFKKAFLKISKKYHLTGNIIKAPLPNTLTRIIVNARLFIKYLSRRLGMHEKEIKRRLTSDGVINFVELIDFLELAPPGSNVVFAAFDENDPEDDPFRNHSVKDILNRLGKGISSFNEGESLNAVKIRYKNLVNIEKKFPVFLDAGWYDKFFPAKRDDKYGRTRSLDSSLEGMAEIVHRNLKISDITDDIQLLED